MAQAIRIYQDSPVMLNICPHICIRAELADQEDIDNGWYEYCTTIDIKCEQCRTTYTLIQLIN